MLRKLLCALMVATLLFILAVPAFAATTRYCPICDEDTSWANICSGSKKNNTGYYNHTGTTGEVCNFYLTYFYTSQKCQKCYSSIFRLSTTHLETATHNVCGTFDRCAY